MLGVFEQRWAMSPGPRRSADDAVWLALEAVRDPGNLGTIVRTADAVGAAGRDPRRRTPSIPIRAGAVRASMGSIFDVRDVRIAPDQLGLVKGDDDIIETRPGRAGGGLEQQQVL